MKILSSDDSIMTTATAVKISFLADLSTAEKKKNTYFVFFSS